MEISRFDIADYLDSKEMIAEYLNTVLTIMKVLKVRTGDGRAVIYLLFFDYRFVGMQLFSIFASFHSGRIPVAYPASGGRVLGETYKS